MPDKTHDDADDELVQIVEGRATGGAQVQRAVKNRLMELHNAGRIVYMRLDRTQKPSRFVIRVHGETRVMEGKLAAAWCLGVMDAGHR